MQCWFFVAAGSELNAESQFQNILPLFVGTVIADGVIGGDGGFESGEKLGHCQLDADFSEVRNAIGSV